MSESEPPRRKTLSLKSPVAAPGGPPPLERMVKPSARTTVFTPQAAPSPPRVPGSAYGKMVRAAPQMRD